MTGAGSHKPFDSEHARAMRPAQTDARPRRRARQPVAPAPTEDAPPSLDPGAIARVLRVVADEVERDPALARRVAAATAQLGSTAPAADSDGMEADHGVRVRRTGPAMVGTKPFKARIVTGAGPDLGPGIPDPFALRARLGRDGLCAALEELRLGTLRAIVREYHLDATGRTPQHNDATRLRQLIVEGTEQGR
jgi:hypothetical protein